jgi:hypothetical protein
MDPKHPNRLIVGTNKIYESTTNGDSWNQIADVFKPQKMTSDQYIVALAIAPSATKTIYAATADGRLFVTTNDGTNWSEIDSGLPVDSFDQIGAIQVDPKNAKHVFIATTGHANAVFGPLHVWQSTNGGMSWTSSTGNLPSTTYVTDLIVDWRFTTPVLYAGTARGVYRSLNKGRTWSVFGTGLPDTQVYDMQLQTNQDILAVATFGRGAFEISVPGPATHFSISAPATVTAGGGFSITVTALDALNLVAVAYLGTIQFTSSDSAAVLPANYTFTSTDAGTHSFSVSLNTVGTQSITATDTVTSSVTGTASGINVTASCRNSLGPEAGDGEDILGRAPELGFIV